MNSQRDSMLRKALMANAIFSTLSGLAILLAHVWVLQILGLPQTVSLMFLGIGLLAFAATLIINARREQVKTSDAWVAVSMDVAWVLASLVLVFVAPFSTSGKWVVVGIADLVLLFAMLQFVGIRRLQKSEEFG